MTNATLSSLPLSAATFVVYISPPSPGEDDDDDTDGFLLFDSPYAVFRSMVVSSSVGSEERKNRSKKKEQENTTKQQIRAGSAKEGEEGNAMTVTVIVMVMVIIMMMVVVVVMMAVAMVMMIMVVIRVTITFHMGLWGMGVMGGTLDRAFHVSLLALLNKWRMARRSMNKGRDTTQCINAYWLVSVSVQNRHRQISGCTY